MTRTDLSFGPLDCRTPDGALPDPARTTATLRLRTAEGVVPHPRGGYVAPEAPSVTLDAVRPFRALAWEDRADDVSLLGVTDADLRRIDPTGVDADAVLYTYGVAEAARTAEFAALPLSVFVTSKGSGPERPVVVKANASEANLYPTPWLPRYDTLTLGQADRVANETGGLTVGTYAVRLAGIRRDQSLGPAGLPRLVGLSIQTHPYLTLAPTVGGDTLTVIGLDANEDFQALKAAYPGSGLVPLSYINPGLPGDYETATLYGMSSEEDGTNTKITLSEPLPYDFSSAGSVALGDRVRLTVDGSLAVPDSGQEDGFYTGVAVFVSPPLESYSEAPDAPYFRLGDLPLTGIDFDSGDETTDTLLGKAALTEGESAAGLYASGVTPHAGRLIFSGVAFDPPAPDPGLLCEVQNEAGPGDTVVARYLFAVNLDVQGGRLGRWSRVIPTKNEIMDVRRILFYPDPQASSLSVYKETPLGSGAYLLADTVPLTPTASGGASFALRDVVGSFGTATGEAAPDAAARAGENVRLDTDRRRLVVTGAGLPYQIRAERVLNVAGTGAMDTVQTVRALAAPVSAGQYGQFPLVAFSAASVTALETDGTGEVTALRLLSAARGAASPQAVVTDGQGLFYLDGGRRAGVYALGIPGLSPDANLAASILTTGAGGDALTSPDPAPTGVAWRLSADPTAALALYGDSVRRELWVFGTGVDERGEAARRAFVLDLAGVLAGSEPRWTVLDRPRLGQVEAGNAVEAASPLTTFDGDHVYREADGADVEPFRIVTAPAAVASGLDRLVQRVAVSGDLSVRLQCDLSARVRRNSAPGVRAEQETVPLVSLLLDGGSGFETTARCRASHVITTLNPAPDDTTVPGDRIRGVHLVTAGVVRERRRRRIIT